MGVFLKYFFYLFCLNFCFVASSGPGSFILPDGLGSHFAGSRSRVLPFSAFYKEVFENISEIKDSLVSSLSEENMENIKTKLPSFLVKNYDLDSESVEWFLKYLSRYSEGQDAHKTLFSLMVQNEKAVTEMLKMIDPASEKFGMWIDFLEKYQGSQKIVSLLSTPLPSGHTMQFSALYQYVSVPFIKNLKFLSQYISSEYGVRDTSETQKGDSKPVKSLILHMLNDPPSEEDKSFLFSFLLQGHYLKKIPGKLITKQSSLFRKIAFLEEYTGGKVAFFHLLRSSSGMKRTSFFTIPYEKFLSNIQNMEKMTAKVLKAERGGFLNGLFDSSLKQKAQALVARALKEGRVNPALILQDVKTVRLINGDLVDEVPAYSWGGKTELNWRDVKIEYAKLRSPKQKRKFLEENLLSLSGKQIQELVSHTKEADTPCRMFF